MDTAFAANTPLLKYLHKNLILPELLRASNIQNSYYVRNTCGKQLDPKDSSHSNERAHALPDISARR